MEIKQFIGVDVSKSTLDFALAEQGKVIYHMRVENTPQGIGSFIKAIKKGFSFDVKQGMFCMEHNGIYNNILLKFLMETGANIWVESALQIKQSLGMIRGKNDKADSGRIALYAYKNKENFKAWQPPRQVISQIKQLLVVRNRIIEAIHQLETPVGKDAQIFMPKDQLKNIRKCCIASIKAMKQDLKTVTKQIEELGKKDEQLNRLFKIVMSVDGVGLITAAILIVATNEFKNFANAKKFACYAGVVPFEYSSGSSIRGKSRVSHIANKTVKKALHLAILTGIRKKGEFRQYYERKVAEGKHKMSVINAIRNKLILRIFACVRENRLFEKKYSYLLA
jgi:transposase